MKSMAKKLLLLCCILALCLTGCGGKASTVRGVQLTEREQRIAALAGDNAGVIEFSFAEDIQGMILQKEIWKYGQLQVANMVAYGGTDTMQALYISHRRDRINEGIPEIRWELLKAEENTYSQVKPFVQIAFPECKDKEFGCSSSFWGWDNKKPVTLEAGNSYILSVEAIDLLGDGWMGISCGAYAEQERFIKGNDCVILLRLDTFATAEEAEAEVEARKQENRAESISRL